jgi:MoxR-like ATPase
VRVDEIAGLGESLSAEIAKVIVGQAGPVRSLVTALLSQGHILLEGVPGTAKTLLVRTLAFVLDVPFARVQFSPDMMPSDVIGTNVYDLESNRFHLKRGPIFTGFLLADEINRTPPKTQAALLEAMEERQVTVDGESYPLPPVFMVVATENPIEYEGTYPLPESELDRFQQKVVIAYPSEPEEMEILSRHHAGFGRRPLSEMGLAKVADADTLLAARAAVDAVTVQQDVASYIAAIIRRTRGYRDLRLGASPRAGVDLLVASKTAAALAGRDYITPDDVKGLAAPVLRHRLQLTAEAEIEGVTTDDVLDAVIAEIPVPR